MGDRLVLPSRMGAIQNFRSQAGQIAAVLPIHAPRALLRAFGYLPVEVWGPPRVDPSYGSAHLQAYVCSIARNALAFLESGGLDVASLVLVPHACDSLQGLGSLLIDFVKPKQPVFTFYMPRGRRDSDRDFLSAELRMFYEALATLTGRAPSDQELLECIDREEKADARLAALHHRRCELPLSQLELYRLIRSREYLPAEDFTQIADHTLRLAEPGLPKPGIPVILSGIVPEPMELFAALDELGAYIAADDLACCGRRLYPPGEGDDPFQRMAGSLLGAAPDPMNGSPLATRLDHLLNLARSNQAKGVIFYDLKFCEPELFDLPTLRVRLQGAGLRSLTLEVDLSGDRLPQQTLTRLEAFVESLS